MYANYIFDLTFISFSAVFYFFLIFFPANTFSGITMEKSFPMLAITFIFLIYNSYLKILKDRFHDNDFISDWTDVLFHFKILSKLVHKGQYIFSFILFCFFYLYMEMFLYHYLKFSTFSAFWILKVLLYMIILFLFFYPLYKLFIDLNSGLKEEGKKHKFTNSNFLNFDPLGEFVEEPRINPAVQETKKEKVEPSNIKFVIFLSFCASFFGVMPLYLFFSKIARWPYHFGTVSYVLYLFLIFFSLKSLLLITNRNKEDFSLLTTILAPLGMGILYFY